MLTYALLSSLQGNASLLHSSRKSNDINSHQQVGKRVRKKRRMAKSSRKGHEEYTIGTILAKNRMILQESMSLLHSIKSFLMDKPNDYHKILDCLVRHAHGRATAGDAVNTISALLKDNPLLLRRFSNLLKFEGQKD